MTVDEYVEKFIEYWDIKNYSVEKCMLGELCSFEEALDPDSGANLEPEKLKKIAENKKWLDDHWQEVEKALLKKQEELRK